MNSISLNALEIYEMNGRDDTRHGGGHGGHGDGEFVSDKGTDMTK